MTKLEIIADGRIIKQDTNHFYNWIRYDTIYDAYQSPGIRKIQIWERIEENAKRIDATVGISSRNCNYFSCVGFFLDEEYNHVEFKLTKEYCYIRYNH